MIKLFYKLQMLYLDRIDVSKGIDTNKISKVHQKSVTLVFVR